MKTVVDLKNEEEILCDWILDQQRTRNMPRRLTGRVLHAVGMASTKVVYAVQQRRPQFGGATIARCHSIIYMVPHQLALVRKLRMPRLTFAFFGAKRYRLHSFQRSFGGVPSIVGVRCSITLSDNLVDRRVSVMRVVTNGNVPFIKVLVELSRSNSFVFL